MVENETTFMKFLQVEFGEVAIGDKGGLRQLLLRALCYVFLRLYEGLVPKSDDNIRWSEL
jgi:hypothetical protein